jgi:tellurite resistance protein TehA-like permease
MCQQAVSARIRAMEAQTGVALVHRTPRGSHLTAECAVIAELAARLLDVAAGLDAGIAALRQDTVGVAGTALPRPYPAGAAVFALLYGVPTWGFAMLWLALATAITVRTARHGLPFGLTWWSFTFPVGTVVTGTISLAARTGSEALRGASVLLFGLLAVAWLVVAARTAVGSIRGRLFLPMLSQVSD